MSRITTHIKSTQNGRSLIELMIGLALGLIVIAAASAAYISSVKATRVSEVESRLNETAALTLGILQQQVRLAGYSDIAGSSTYTIRKNFNGAGMRGCSGGFSGTLTVPFASIACSGIDGSTSLPDSIVVRYQANAANTVPTGLGTPTNCIGDGIAATTSSDVTSTTPGSIALPQYALAENRYYIKTSDTPSGSPELYCLGLTGPSSYSTPYPLMEGVEYMQLTYGVAATTTGTITTAYMTAKDIDSTYSTEPDRWKRVVSTKICVVLVNADSSYQGSRFTDSDTNKYYNCGNQLQTSTDGKIRRSYSTTVLAKNKLSQIN
jgi:type IV pilus assembly protein PilW